MRIKENMLKEQNTKLHQGNKSKCKIARIFSSQQSILSSNILIQQAQQKRSGWPVKKRHNSRS